MKIGILSQNVIDVFHYQEYGYGESKVLLVTDEYLNFLNLKKMTQFIYKSPFLRIIAIRLMFLRLI